MVMPIPDEQAEDELFPQDAPNHTSDRMTRDAGLRRPEIPPTERLSPSTLGPCRTQARIRKPDHWKTACPKLP